MNLSYQDPILVQLYDKLNMGRQDHAYYASLAALCSGPILELGCGSGTPLLYIVERERDHFRRFVGIDPAHEMLALARQKQNAERVTWVAGTLKTFQDPMKFDLIFMAGHAFQCFLNDAETQDTFRLIADLLTPEGIFAFETRNLDVKPWLNWCAGGPSDVTIRAQNGEAVRVWHEVQTISDAFVTFDQKHHFLTQDRLVVSQSTLRFWALDEIINLAQNAGLMLSRLHGDWDAKNFEKNDKEMIFQFRRGHSEIVKMTGQRAKKII